MPRSGTTLLEQILSAHQKVFGAGELDFLRQIINKNFNNKEGKEKLSNMIKIDINYIRTLDTYSFKLLFQGLINREFDISFLDRISNQPEELTKIHHHDYIMQAGSEGVELVMWLVMRGVLEKKVREIYRHYHVPASNTAAGLIILEDDE